MNYREKKREKIFEVFEKFPDISNRMTAKILFRDYPEYFKSVEEARGLVRAYRGSNGKGNREKVKFRKYYR